MYLVKLISLFSWMPAPILTVVLGILSIFIIWSLLKIAEIIVEVIPFI